MKYKCIILDHDDTVVNSTATIHYPSFLEYLKITRPERVGEYTLEGYFVKNFHPGVEALFLEELGMSENEFLEEQKFWSEYVKGHIPKAYPGLKEILWDYKSKGGIIAVASHSYTKYIIRDYEHNGLPSPDAVYSWDLPAELRKPNPFAVFDIMNRFDLTCKDILMIDDLKPGYDMAKAAGCDFAAAGWGYDVAEIEDFMRKNCDYYFKKICELGELIK